MVGEGAEVTAVWSGQGEAEATVARGSWGDDDVVGAGARGVVGAGRRRRARGRGGCASTRQQRAATASMGRARAAWQRRRGGGTDAEMNLKNAKCFLIYCEHWSRFVAPTGTNAPL